MTRRVRALEPAGLELDHLHTNSLRADRTRRADVRRSRRTPRGLRAGIALLAGVIVLAFAGGAAFPTAGGGPAHDPYANSVRGVAGAPRLGPATGMKLNSALVGVAATPSGHGNWAAASDGGVFSFGDATFHGSTGNLHLAASVVGIVSTPRGRGYWLVAMDGGIFSYGDARFYGSTAGPAFGANAPIVGMAATPSGHGYWLVSADGGVFTFGDATFRGSAVGRTHGAPILAIAATRTGKGYYLLAANGGVFAFGDAHFAGAAIDTSRVATGIAVPTSGRGYMVVRADASVAGFGGAPSEPAPIDVLWSRHPAHGITARRGGGAWIALSYAAPAPPMVNHAAPSQDGFLRCTRAHESDSAGGYHARSGDGLYHGAYQFLQSTWNNIARAAGRADLVGVDPANAAPADQDSLALWLYQHAGAAPWGGRCAGLA